MQRRQFVQYSSLTALSVLLLRPVEAGESFEHQLLENPELLRFLPDAHRVQEIGDAYRAQYPEENDVHILRSRLLETLTNGRSVSEEAIKDRISLDFEVGDVVRIKGWVLSHTEARQCALYSLLTF